MDIYKDIVQSLEIYLISLSNKEITNVQLINAYLRLLNVYLTSRTEAPELLLEPSNYIPTALASSKKHIIKSLRLLGLEYLVPKPNNLFEQKKAFRIFSALHDKIVARHGKNLAYRVNSVVKREQLLMKKNANKGIVLKNFENTSNKEESCLPSTCPDSSASIPAGSQIPRTPLKCSTNKANSQSNGSVAVPCNQIPKNPLKFINNETGQIPVKCNKIPQTPLKCDVTKNSCEVIKQHDPEASFTIPHIPPFSRTALISQNVDPVMTGKEIPRTPLKCNIKYYEEEKQDCHLSINGNHAPMNNNKNEPKNTCPVIISGREIPRTPLKCNDRNKDCDSKAGPASIPDNKIPFKSLLNFETNKKPENDPSLLNPIPASHSIKNIRKIPSSITQAVNAKEFFSQPIAQDNGTNLIPPTKAVPSYNEFSPSLVKQDLKSQDQKDKRKTFSILNGTIGDLPSPIQPSVESNDLNCCSVSQSKDYTKQLFTDNSDCESPTHPSNSNENETVEPAISFPLEKSNLKQPKESKFESSTSMSDLDFSAGDKSTLFRSRTQNETYVVQKFGDNSIVTVMKEPSKKTLIKTTRISELETSTLITEISYVPEEKKNKIPSGRALPRTPPTLDPNLLKTSKLLKANLAPNCKKNDTRIQIYINQNDSSMRIPRMDKPVEKELSPLVTKAPSKHDHKPLEDISNRDTSLSFEDSFSLFPKRKRRIANVSDASKTNFEADEQVDIQDSDLQDGKKGLSNIDIQIDGIVTHKEDFLSDQIPKRITRRRNQVTQANFIPENDFSHQKCEDESMEDDKAQKLGKLGLKKRNKAPSKEKEENIEGIKLENKNPKPSLKKSQENKCIAKAKNKGQSVSQIEYDKELIQDYKAHESSLDGNKSVLKENKATRVQSKIISCDSKGQRKGRRANQKKEEIHDQQKTKAQKVTTSSKSKKDQNMKDTLREVVNESIPKIVKGNKKALARQQSKNAATTEHPIEVIPEEPRFECSDPQSIKTHVASKRGSRKKNLPADEKLNEISKPVAANTKSNSKSPATKNIKQVSKSSGTTSIKQSKQKENTTKRKGRTEKENLSSVISVETTNDISSRPSRRCKAKATVAITDGFNDSLY